MAVGKFSKYPRNHEHKHKILKCVILIQKREKRKEKLKKKFQRRDPSYSHACDVTYMSP
jgi:hypothetical protein